MIKKLLINYNETIVDALNKLNELKGISRLILFVQDREGKILGSITDGDIRRSIAMDQRVDKSVEQICNTDFLYEYSSDDYLFLGKYKNKDIKILPILNKSHQLIDIIDLDKVNAKLPLECMVMAGGRGKRLSPLTDTVPKPMLPLGGKPIIEHNIDRLINFGIKKIYISLKYLGNQIQEYFGDGSDKGISIEYIWEDEPLGTAGALGLVDHFNTDHVLLMNSDLLTNVDFESMYTKLIKENADMVVASTEYKVDVPYAVFETEENKVKAFKEKPSYIYHSNAGVYILKRELIQKMPKKCFYDITDLMDDLVEKGGELIYDPIMGYWIDIGKPIDYKQAQEFIKHIEAN
nr:nucleotidyltransferase family protein [Aquimarina agarilytica]